MEVVRHRQNRVRTVCPYCGVGCGLLVTPRSRGAIVKGDPDHPANRGRLCCKGVNLGETLDPKDRLLRPHIEGRVATWDEALDLIAARFRQALTDHGPDSIAFYASGQLLTEDYYVANKLMKGFIGSANIDTNSRLCMASAVSAHQRTFGSDTVPGTFEDFEKADLVVLVGSNLAWCHPVLYQRIIEAKAARPDLTLVCIDPRQTTTAALADLHLPLRPGSDLALFNGLLAKIEQTGSIDHRYVESHTSGLRGALEAAKALSASEIAAITGLSPDLLQQFYSLWVSHDRVVTLFSQGINQSIDGTDKASAIINCHLVSGRIGREGMGPFSITGQPNAMGGREVGGLASILAAHLDLETEEHSVAVRDFWNAPRIARMPGLKAVDLFHACKDGRIKALWILSTNPVDSMPEADLVRTAIRDCPFVVVSDIIAGTDSADLADVLLPAAAWGEKSGTVTNADRTISRQRAFRAPPGEARPDWQILCDVARRLGWGEAFDFQNPAAVFREHAALSGVASRLGGDFDISDLAEIDEEAYAALEPFRWPAAKSKTGGRFFADGAFHTSDRRARITATPYRPCMTAPSLVWPLRLITGRIRDQWHTMTRSGTAPHLSRRHPEPCVEIHPADAERFDIGDSKLVTLESPLGRSILRARITEETPEGAVFAPIHWSDRYAACARIDALIPSHRDPTSGQPAFKASLARITRFDPLWWAAAAAGEVFRPKSEYWALAREPGAWAASLAGNDWQGVGPAMIGLERHGDLSIVESGIDCIFAVITENERIEALFLASRMQPTLTAPQLASQLGHDADKNRLRTWRQQAEQEKSDQVVCACFSIGASTIRETIVAQGLSDIDAVGRSLRAGTNCGTCRPEIATLLAKALSPFQNGRP